jgi:hypothetical protein
VRKAACTQRNELTICERPNEQPLSADCCETLAPIWPSYPESDLGRPGRPADCVQTAATHEVAKASNREGECGPFVKGRHAVVYVFDRVSRMEWVLEIRRNSHSGVGNETVQFARIALHDRSQRQHRTFPTLMPVPDPLLGTDLGFIASIPPFAVTFALDLLSGITRRLFVITSKLLRLFPDMVIEPPQLVLRLLKQQFVRFVVTIAPPRI